MTVPAPTRLYPPFSLQLTLRLLQDGQEAAVVLGAVGEVNPVASQATADGWRDVAWNSFRPLISNRVQCVGALLRETGAADGQVVEAGPPTTPAGGSAAASTLAAGSTLLRWTTTRGGRSGKGRTFLPGLPVSAVQDNGRAYQAAHGTLVNTAVTAYLGAGFWGTSNLDPAVLSFTKGFASPITSGALASVVGVQRRRMR